MNSLQELIPKIQQAREERSIYRLSTLAEQALEATLDEKLIKSGSLQWLANRLSDVIKEFEKTDIRIDDLRYRLAHLYMRSQKWEEANDQLLELEESDYCKTEAQIYSALCSIKQGFQPDISKIAEQWNKVNTVKTKSIQEQHYDLLEMLVYAARLEHSNLNFYYKKGSTKARLKIRYFDNKNLSNYSPLWLTIADFRLEKLLYDSPNFLIIDLTNNFRLGKLEKYRTSLREPLHIMVTQLAINFPNSVSIQNLQKELKSYTTYKHRISEWKGELCDYIKNNLNGKIDAIINTGNNQSEYLLNHSFILIQNRSQNRENPRSDSFGETA